MGRKAAARSTARTKRRTGPIRTFSFLRKWFSREKWSAHIRKGHTEIHHFQADFLQRIKKRSGYAPVRAFRRYAAFSVVVSSALVVSVTNFAQGHEGALLPSTVGNKATIDAATSKRNFALSNSRKQNLSLVPLSNAPTAVDPNQKEDAVTPSDLAGSPVLLSAEAGNAMARDPEEDGGVKIYTVQSGDTVSTIAAHFNITVNTILWANDLQNVDEIRPGDQLFIMPVAGFSYMVKSGDTIDSIAGKYKADRDQILSYNGLPANGELTVGDQIIIPNGQKETPIPKPIAPSTGGLQPRQYATPGGGTPDDISGSRKLEGKAGTGHRFPYGYCTWYVAQKRYVPWSGNAGTWIYNAKAMGYRTGRTPAAGSMIVTTENRYYGHVALVESVNGDGTITVSEMNYNAWGKVDHRVISIANRAIKGYIY